MMTQLRRVSFSLLLMSDAVFFSCPVGKFFNWWSGSLFKVVFLNHKEIPQFLQAQIKTGLFFCGDILYNFPYKISVATNGI